MEYTDMEKENAELKRQLAAATEFILKCEKVLHEDKSVVAMYKAAADSDKAAADKLISSLKDTPPKMEISSESEEAFLKKIRETPCGTPDKRALTYLFKEIFRETAPDLEYKVTRTIKGKKWFWCSIAILVAVVIVESFLWYKRITFDGTPESWAHRMYAAQIELKNPNPGEGYHEIMTDFSNGKEASAKEKVVRSEDAAREFKEEASRYENKINLYFSQKNQPETEVLAVEKTERNIYHEAPLDRIFSPDRCEYVLLKTREIGEENYYYILLKRERGLGINNKYDIFITTNRKFENIDYYINHQNDKGVMQDLGAI